MILALDISTSCTGWCVFDENGYRDIGYIDLSKHKGMYEKAGRVKTELLNLMIKYLASKIIAQNIISYLGSLYIFLMTKNISINKGKCINLNLKKILENSKGKRK